MFRSVTMLFVAIAFGVFINNPVSAQSEIALPKDIAAEEMIGDALLVRPMGIVATVAGTAAFVLALPFTLPSGTAEQAARTLVVEPAEYTFRRPLGDMTR